MMKLKILPQWRKEPELVSLYAGQIKKRKTLKNGWNVIILKNKFAHFYRFVGEDASLQDFSVGNLHKITETKNGFFMVTRYDGKKAIFDKNGETLANFDSETQLYFNGWYVKKSDEGYSLYDSKNVCLGSNLKAAKVFKNGYYLMATGDVVKDFQVNIFNKKREKLITTNDSHVSQLKNGWFFAEHTIWDETGNEFIFKIHGHNFQKPFLKCMSLISKL